MTKQTLLFIMVLGAAVNLCNSWPSQGLDVIENAFCAIKPCSDSECCMIVGQMFDRDTWRCRNKPTDNTSACGKVCECSKNMTCKNNVCVDKDL